MWRFAGQETFKGKKYLKFERVDPVERGKNFLNLNEEQVKAILDCDLMMLADFAGVTPPAV